MMQFIIWGAGYRGKSTFDLLGEERVVAFIDGNQKLIGNSYCGKEIISYQTYIEKYSQYFIIISPANYNDIVEKLRKDGIYQYFLLASAPSEFIGYGSKMLLEKLPIKIDYQTCNAIYGTEIFSVLLYEIMLEKGCEKLYIIPSKNFEPKKIAKIKELLKIKNILTLEKLSEEIATLYITVQEDKKDLSKYIGRHTKLEDFFDFSQRIEEYHHIEIEKFKENYKGKRCFIIGLGSSLNSKDLDILNKYNEFTISMNQIHKIFSLTDWRPDFYAVTDRNALEHYSEDILKINVKAKFLIDSADNAKIYKHKDVYKINVVHTQTKFGLPKFSEDCAWHIYGGGTVTYVCMQLAVYMGFQEIILLGVDFDYNQHETAKHFYEVGSNKSSGCYEKNESYLAYQAARYYADTHGIKILNATRGGELEVFDRVDFDGLF